jgi:hypothetical protein
LIFFWEFQYKYIFIGNYNRRFNFNFNNAPDIIADLIISQILIKFIFWFEYRIIISIIFSGLINVIFVYFENILVNDVFVNFDYVFDIGFAFFIAVIYFVRTRVFLTFFSLPLINRNLNLNLNLKTENPYF